MMQTVKPRARPIRSWLGGPYVWCVRFNDYTPGFMGTSLDVTLRAAYEMLLSSQTSVLK